jgi:hypothetical protein
MIEPRDVLKILDDMAGRNASTDLMADVYDRLSKGITDLPADIQKKAMELIAGQKRLEQAVFDKDVREYVLSITGSINAKEVMSFFDARADQKRHVYDLLRDMETDGLITRTGSRHGTYRLVDRNPHIMNLDATDEKASDIYLPMLLHTMVELYPRNIILVSGEKDAGKTCFALNVAYANRDTYPVRYFNSEMGSMELRRRLIKFPSSFRMAEWKKIVWMEQAKQFEDHIDPNGLNIIDFLEVGAEAYTVTEDIRRVFDKLDRGLLLIVMQKRSYKEFAVGGEGTLEKARLAVNLEHNGGDNIARITVAKNWKGDERPRGKVCRYKIVQGGDLRMDGTWYDPDKGEANPAKKGFTKKSAKVYNLGGADPDFPHEE